MAFGEELLRKGRTGLGQAGARILDDVFGAQTELRKKYGDFKRLLGYGFRDNLFIGRFRIPRDTFKVDSDLGIDVNVDEEIFYTLDKDFKSGQGLLNVIVDAVADAVVKKLGGDESDFIEFPLLLTGFQVPGLKLTQTNEIVKHQKFVRDLEKGSMTATFLIDQFADLYTYWNYYISSVTDGEIMWKYPDEYQFDIEIDVMTGQDEWFQRFRFFNCTALGYADLDLSYKSYSEIPTMTIDIDYEDFMITQNAAVRILKPSPIFARLFPIIENLYGEEVVFLLKQRILYQLILPALDGNFSGQSTEINQLVANASSPELRRLISNPRALTQEEQLLVAREIAADNGLFTEIVNSLGN